jgi:hypothetical protein
VASDVVLSKLLREFAKKHNKKTSEIYIFSPLNESLAVKIELSALRESLPIILFT